MATIKQDRKDFEALLNGIAPVISSDGTPMSQDAANQVLSSTQQINNVVDNTADGNFTVEKVFEFDYEGTRKGLRKQARKTVWNIIEHIFTEEYQSEQYILDKAEQDTDTLCEIYMQQSVNTLMQKSLIESVARGNTMPRMYEVFGQLTDRISSLSKQILETEQKIRKTYLDLKFEIVDKKNEMIGENMASSGNALTSGGGGMIISSPKDLISMARANHIESVTSEENKDIQNG